MSSAEGRPPSYGSTRGRPRSEAVEQAILEGVMKLLEDGVPLADVSIERIARSAGVGKAAIYRRWSDKEDLFVDVMWAAEPAEPELPGTSMRDDLVVLLESLRQRALVSGLSAILHNAHAQMRSSPKLWAAYHSGVITPRRDLGLEILRRGRTNGELRTDVDLELAVEMFVGPLLTRAFIRHDPDLPDELAEQIVDTVLHGLRPVSSASS
ncbi:TetR/AcrR family transcriptional regulator [Streptomyces phaeochromogenes]|uniref:TetR/AcrR family transcriptional regulator n=1 Tax=Streptomyces phaeochromogenes TaxID=1923 RepID=A0ABZ1HUZ1_STRPH|nr:TetR/AcrR family transcriptional regulator [Streptomyces phaeochromogenes]WSD21085.1 TetR/AcrR family transcriptional regulator [Streptomyces phaeochromogenes]